MRVVLVIALSLTSCLSHPVLGSTTYRDLTYGESEAVYAGCVRGVLRLYLQANAPVDMIFVRDHCIDVQKSFDDVFVDRGGNV